MTAAELNPPLRWTALVGAGLHAMLLARADRLADADYWTDHTAAIQRRVLRRLLTRAAGTCFGRDHGFDRLSRTPERELLAAYRAAVPVADWYGFKDRIGRMRDGGEPGVLWPGRVLDFAQTSGTTAGDKYIPVSREMMRSNRKASLDIFAHLVRRGVPLARLLGGRCLFLGGSTALDVNSCGVRTGDLSGLVTPLIRWPISAVYSPGPDVALLSHWPTKLDAMARRCAGQDVRMISGMPSWTLALFDRLVGATGGTIRDLWPNLEVFVHGGVRYAPFDPRVRQFWSGSAGGDDIPVRHEVYPASEAFVAMQDSGPPEGAGPGWAAPLRVCADHGVFYEFVPADEIDGPSPRAMALGEVEPGVRYVVVLTTCAGLWRYVLGDVVEFETVPAGAVAGTGPARLRIVGRHRHFINAFGENIIVEHIEGAVAEAAPDSGLIVGEFTSAPVYPGPSSRPGLELAVEISGDPGDRLERFARRFDEAIKARNVDYATKRTGDVGMAPPTITPLPPGTIHDWMRSRGKLGGQHKCPRCANHRDYIDGVLARARGTTIAGQAPTREAPR